MSYIYIVVAAGGEYEDHWHSNLSAWTTRELAHEEMERNIASDNLQAENMKVIISWFEEYKREHPEPVYPTIKKIPRWPSGLGESQITQEMRRERQEINQYNSELIDEYLRKSNEYRSIALEAINEKRVELGMGTCSDMWSALEVISDNILYEVEEIKLGR